MKTLFIKDLKKNQFIQAETFALSEFAIASDKNGKPYANLVLVDKTGNVQAKIWSEALATMDYKNFSPGIIVSISGKVDEYKGKLQFTVNEMKVVQEDQIDAFMQSSEYDSEEMMSDIAKTIETISDAKLKSVLQAMFSDQDFVKSFKYAPAGKAVHHDFRSGLLQHVLEMLEIGKSMRKYYPTVNYDILLAGIILHDIGKFEELLSNGIGISYTKKGSMLGHISLGVMIFDKYAKGKLDENTYLNIVHIILSHHGELQFGSPVFPATLEAVMVSSIDRLSSKSRAAQKAVSEIPEDREAGNPVIWLENARFFRTNEFKDEPQDNNDGILDEDTGDQLIFQE